MGLKATRDHPQEGGGVKLTFPWATPSLLKHNNYIITCTCMLCVIYQHMYTYMYIYVLFILVTVFIYSNSSHPRIIPACSESTKKKKPSLNSTVATVNCIHSIMSSDGLTHTQGACRTVLYIRAAVPLTVKLISDIKFMTSV